MIVENERMKQQFGNLNLNLNLEEQRQQQGKKLMFCFASYLLTKYKRFCKMIETNVNYLLMPVNQTQNECTPHSPHSQLLVAVKSKSFTQNTVHFSSTQSPPHEIKVTVYINSVKYIPHDSSLLQYKN